MFYASLFRLVAHENCRLPPYTGRLAHGAFFEILRAINPETAEHLHHNQGRQPFTVSALMQTRHLQVEAGQSYWLRITLLDHPLFQAVIKYLLQARLYPTIRLDRYEFSIVEVLTMPNSHPRSGYHSLAELENTPNDADTITLNFLSPTAISRGQQPGKSKLFILAPDPVAIWKNLRQQWRTCGGSEPGLEYDTWVSRSVRLMDSSIRQTTWQYGQYPQQGFTGHATFRCESQDMAARQLWHTLAAFSFYAGVGYKTTMGMGQVQMEVAG